MTQHEQQVIKHGDYPKIVIKEWVKANEIEDWIPTYETVYVLNGVITARCLNKALGEGKTIPSEYPHEEVTLYDIYGSYIGHWELKETIQQTVERLTK